MLIEIVTTKKKLTASIVKQMPLATISILETAITSPSVSIILGFVRLSGASYYIIQGKDKLYYKIRKTTWHIHPTMSSNRIRDTKHCKLFNDKEERDYYLVLYKKLQHLGTTHIYLV